jgi:hypothetical protein
MFLLVIAGIIDSAEAMLRDAPDSSLYHRLVCV